MKQVKNVSLLSDLRHHRVPQTGSEEKFRLFKEMTKDFIMTLSLDGRFTDVNRAMVEATGYSKAEILAMRLGDMVDSRHLPVIAERLRTGNPQDQKESHDKIEFIDKTGKPILVELSARFIRQNNRSAAVLVSARNIDGQKRAEQALRESETRHRSFFESVGLGYFEVDLKGRLVFFNDALCDIIRCSREELSKMSHREFMDQENIENICRIFKKVVQTGKPEIGVIGEVTSKDGQIRRIGTSVSIMSDPQGRPVGFRGMVRDISDRKNLEEQLAQAKKLESIGQLAAGIAHEINTPTQYVSDNAHFLKDAFSDINRLLLKYETLFDAAKAGALTGDLIAQTAAAIEQADLGYLREEIPLAIQQSLEGMEYKILIVDDDANVLATYKRLLRKQFHVDVSQGGMQGLSAVSGQGPYAVVISDLRMPGMDGFQFLSSVRGVAPDSVRMILTGYADLPTAMKAINEGKIFQLLTKPCAPEALTNAITSGIEQFVKNRRISHQKETNRRNGSSQKILIVDDDPFIRDVLSEAFRPYDGFEIIEAENGRTAIECLSRTKIDMIITDLKMPVLSGSKLLSYMNKMHLKIPVVVLTGHGTPEIEAKVNAFNNFMYFEKPFDVNVLIDTVTDALASVPPSQIHGIGVDAFLQMVEMEMKTCTLTIKSKNKIGYLYFLRGDLIAAETKSLKGHEAAYDILGWENIVIEIENACIIKQREIHQNLMEILMESARIKDDDISMAAN